MTTPIALPTDAGLARIRKSFDVGAVLSVGEVRLLFAALDYWREQAESLTTQVDALAEEVVALRTALARGIAAAADRVRETKGATE